MGGRGRGGGRGGHTRPATRARAAALQRLAFAADSPNLLLAGGRVSNEERWPFTSSTSRGGSSL